MSEEQKDAVIGRVVRERTEIKRHIATLEAEAHRIGEMFGHISRDLTNRPERVGFNGISSNIRYSKSSGMLFDPKDIDGNKIVKLITELRTALDKLEALDQEARNLGIDS